MGAGHAAQYAAANAARHLRAGTKVRVHAAGFDICHSPHTHLVLVGVDFIEHLEVHYTETVAERPLHTA